MRAWAEMFDAFLAGLDDSGADTSPYSDADYFAHVDGKPRYDGVRDFLTSRGIRLPEGDPADPPDAETVCGLGNRKNDAFNVVLERDGVDPYPGSVALLDTLRAMGMPLAVVSSSANAPAVLDAARLADRFVAVVDGRVAGELGLPGKPAPDTFVHAATLCGTSPDRSVVVEDAVSGVRAGCRGRLRPRHRRRPWGRRRRAHRGRRPGRRHGPRGARVKAYHVDGHPHRPQPVPRGSVEVRRVRPRPGRPRGHRACSPSPTATSGCAATRRRAVTPTSTAPSSTASTRRGPSATRRRPSGSHAPLDDRRHPSPLQADEALRRRRAPRHRHRRPRALRAQPRLP